MNVLTTQELIRTYQSIFNQWKDTKIIYPNWHVLDNEAPKDLKRTIQENGCKVELTPADIHRQNATKCAIQTFKRQFIGILTGVADDFLIHQWDKLVPQIVLMISLLQQSNVAPNVLAYTHHHAVFDYNQMPLAPMGCAVQFHIKPTWCK